MTTNLLAANYDDLVNDIVNTIDVSSAGGFTFDYEIDLAFSTGTADTFLPTITVDPGSHLSIVGEAGGTVLEGLRMAFGFKVAAGQVTLSNLTVKDFVETGNDVVPLTGNGGDAGLGGGLFVSSSATVTLDNVSFDGNGAYGGNGSSGGRPIFPSTNKYGYGGAAGTAAARQGAIGTLGAPSEGLGIGSGGESGGAGGAAGVYNTLLHHGYGGGAGAPGESASQAGFGYGGAAGGGGGGGGGSADGTYGPAPFLPFGGDGGAAGNGGVGGFGGGGGGGGAAGGGGGGVGHGGIGGTNYTGFSIGGDNGHGGFGGGYGGYGGGGYNGGAGVGAIGGASGFIGGGGGGLGAGGNIFVQQGGTLLFASGSSQNGIVQGGAGGIAPHVLGASDGTAGQALGSGIFIQGNQTVILDPTPGQIVEIDDVIADQGGNGGAGTLEVTGGGLVALAGVNTFTGGVVIAGGRLVEGFSPATLGTGPITFAGPGELNVVAGVPANTIAGWAAGDTVDVPGNTNPVTASATLSGNVVTVTVGPASYHINVSGLPAGTHFSAIETGGGTAVTIACFAAGTRLLTQCGETPVEGLRAGDTVTAVASGALRRVIWTGRRTIDLARHPTPDRVAPIRIRAHAFAEGIPHRDLRLSPDHAIYVDGVLVPAARLVNNATILREYPATITYHHIELARHEILLAEGLPCESYLDTANRAAFTGSLTTLHPDFAHRRREASACAPLLTHGPALAAIRARLKPSQPGNVFACAVASCDPLGSAI